MLVLWLGGTALLARPAARALAARGRDAVALFAPWLLLLAVAVPEPPLRSRCMAAFVLLALVAVLAQRQRAAARVGRPAQLAAVQSGAHVPAQTSGLDDPGCRPAGPCVACAVRPLDFALALSLGSVALGLRRRIGRRTRRLARYRQRRRPVGVIVATYRMALLDALTGLPIAAPWTRPWARQSGAYALAMVDVDHFKQLNDTHGHDAGDRVLGGGGAHPGARCTPTPSASGGEEFCLLFRRADDAAAAW